MVNKFLYPNGGSETYMFKLGAYLKSIGHEVEYFGMADERNCVGNRVEAVCSLSRYSAANAPQSSIWSIFYVPFY